MIKIVIYIDTSKTEIDFEIPGFENYLEAITYLDNSIYKNYPNRLLDENGKQVNYKDIVQ